MKEQDKNLHPQIHEEQTIHNLDPLESLGGLNNIEIDM